MFQTTTGDRSDENCNRLAGMAPWPWRCRITSEMVAVPHNNLVNPINKIPPYYQPFGVSAGNRIVKVVPAPGSLVTETWALWRSMISRAIDSPRPVP